MQITTDGHQFSNTKEIRFSLICIVDYHSSSIFSCFIFSSSQKKKINREKKQDGRKKNEFHNTLLCQAASEYISYLLFYYSRLVYLPQSQPRASGEGGGRMGEVCAFLVRQELVDGTDTRMTITMGR